METLLWERLTETFLTEVCRKYHYKKQDIEQLRGVSQDMVSCLKRKESCVFLLPEDVEEIKTDICIPVVMTLGEAVDVLQERYRNTNRLLESYMVEHIGSELLMQGYRQFEHFMAEQTPWQVKAYHFPGAEESYPLKMMPEMLAETGCANVSCTKGFCLQPKKSVVFFAELSKECCAGVEICAGCSRRNGGSCCR